MYRLGIEGCVFMRTKNSEYFEKILNCIEKYKEETGSCPTVREIADETGITKTTVSRYIMDMRDRNIIEYSGHRNITTKSDRGESVRVPLLGAVSCGVPKYAEENIEEYIKLPTSLFGKGEYFLLRANGDSMIDAGINDGDLVLLRAQNTAETGQIVSALIDDEATLKRFYPEPKKGKIRLHPENSALEDIYTDKCVIQGVAVKVIKDLV